VPVTVTRLQTLIDSKVPTGERAVGLAVALHESMHAYGVSNEAEASCYAVQLVPTAARQIGLTQNRANELGSLAALLMRRGAPSGYWDSGRCRDGGAWDMVPDRESIG
jgi:hypothetical protein